MIDQLRALFGGAAGSAGPLRMIQGSAGDRLRIIPVGEVLYFEAVGKHDRVVTTEREHRVRTSLRELLQQLDPQRFWQSHRVTVVGADLIASSSRGETGKLTLGLRGHPAEPNVSQFYAGKFKGV